MSAQSSLLSVVVTREVYDRQHEGGKEMEVLEQIDNVTTELRDVH